MRFIVFRVILAVLLVSILVLIAAFARGYRINFTDQKINSTGILVAQSSPQGAKIYINGVLKGATNQNITLSPGRYEVEITKEGYTSWKSNLIVKGEVVTNATATLFPLNPSLSPVTNLGIVKAQFFPEAEKVIVITDNPNNATSSATVAEGQIEKNGIYVIDNASGPLSLLNGMRLLVGKSKFDESVDLSKLDITMAPDGKELLLTTVGTRIKPTKTFLVTTDKTDQELFDTSRSKSAITTAWDKKRTERTEKILETFKKPFFDLAVNSFDMVAFSPDETKVLYNPKVSVTIPIIIKPRLIGTNQTAEVRTVTRGNLYVYDKKEDRNYDVSRISELVARMNTTNSKIRNIKPSPKIPNTKYDLLNTILWHPNSTQLIVNGEKQVSIFDYDSAHEQTVYSGPFIGDFLAITNDGRLLILANLNPQNNPLPDVYAVGIK